MARDATKLASIYEKIAHTKEFGLLLEAVEMADLYEVLAEEGPFTLFAPNDRAFRGLPNGLLEELFEVENQDRLIEILTVHFVPEKLKMGELPGKLLPTLEGTIARVSNEGGKLHFEGARVIEGDIECSNGVIHIIDEVIIPR